MNRDRLAIAIENAMSFIQGASFALFYVSLGFALGLVVAVVKGHY